MDSNLTTPPTAIELVELQEAMRDTNDKALTPEAILLFRRLVFAYDDVQAKLKHAIRAAKLALFVVDKCGYPNDSWVDGFNEDMRIAEGRPK